jgi:uncharacterized Ntn-hydrolase superfamily protein
LAERTYGTSGLDLMRGGFTSSEALQALLAIDGKRDFRQVSMVDRQGRIATFTGKRCFPEAGSYVGETFCVQANMMLRSTVWQAMSEAFQKATGDLATRLLVALEAAQAEGGDMRGQQTAALLVVDSEPNPIPLIDLRVDHHPKPLIELRRLLRLHHAYMAEYAIPSLIEAGDHEQVTASIVQLRNSGEPYLEYLCALHLAGRLDKLDEAVRILENLISRQPVWLNYLEREAQVDNFGCPGLGTRLMTALKEKK